MYTKCISKLLVINTLPYGKIFFFPKARYTLHIHQIRVGFVTILLPKTCE